MVGVGEQLVAVGDGDDDAALGELGDESRDVLGALGVEVGGRLVEEQQGLGASQARARARRWRCPADSPKPSSPRSADRPPGRAATTPVDLDRAQGLPELVVGGRMADRQRRAHRPGREERPLGHVVRGRRLDRAGRRPAQSGCAGRAASTCRRRTGRSRP